MFTCHPLLQADFYKVGHKDQYPKGTTLIYSNLTPRGTRVPGSEGVINFGEQFFVLDYLRDQFNQGFFYRDKYEVVEEYKRIVRNALGIGDFNVDHIKALHDVGWLPLEVKTLPEGTFVPYRVPLLTIRNTWPEFFWLTNKLETVLSNYLWKPITSATTAFAYRKTFEDYAKKTGADRAFIPWQGHDFSYRGMAGLVDASASGAAHLLSFTGTDTIPAILFLEKYYGANSDTELVGGSVPATEHSVMCLGLEDGEFETFKRLIAEVYPKGIVSIVSDSWDFWRVITEYLPALKDLILSREGKVVIRPDSGDPVKIICGDSDSDVRHVRMGAIRMLWEIFGGKINAAGYRELDSHIGLIYGDSITPERQKEILGRLYRMGFASTNVVLGIGSYTYEYVTRDTHGLAMKATYGEINGVGRAIFKQPKTDSGIKNSAKGLLRVSKSTGLILEEECSWSYEAGGELQTIFKDGVVSNRATLAEIRKRVESYL